MSVDFLLYDETELFPKPLPAKVLWAIAPNHPGRVEFQATSWAARLYQSDSYSTVLADHWVAVVGREGNTLLVQAAQ